MKPLAFDYVRADSSQELADLLRAHGSEARIMAGGQSLMAVLNMRLAQPGLLVDISRVSDLDYARIEKNCLVIGAAATQASVEWRPGLEAEVPLLHQAFPHISHFQIRNKGTVCGSIAHADPSAELPLILLALGGKVTLRSHRGRRELDAADFFQGMLLTARKDDEFIEAVRYPLLGAGQSFAFDEFSARHGDFAMAAVAVVVGADYIRFAVGGVADRPRLQSWPRLEGADLEAAVNDFAWELGAEDGPHISAAFRRQLVRTLGMSTLKKAMA